MRRYITFLFTFLMLFLLIGCSVEIINGSPLRLPVIEDFEEWKLGGLSADWRYVGKPVEWPHSMEATDKHVSPFVDMFPAGAKSLYFYDADPAAFVDSWVDVVGNNAEQYIFYSMDFKIIDGDVPIIVYFHREDFKAWVVLRIRPGAGLETYEFDPAANAAEIEAILPSEQLTVGNWYRIQFILRGTGNAERGSLHLVDIKWQEFGKAPLEFKKRNLGAPTLPSRIKTFRISSSFGRNDEMGGFVVDNILMRALDYGVNSTLTLDEQELVLSLKEDFYGSAAQNAPVSLTIAGKQVTGTTDDNGLLRLGIEGTDLENATIEVTVTTPWGAKQTFEKVISAE